MVLSLVYFRMGIVISVHIFTTVPLYTGLYNNSPSWVLDLLLNLRPPSTATSTIPEFYSYVLSPGLKLSS